MPWLHDVVCIGWDLGAEAVSYGIITDNVTFTEVNSTFFLRRLGSILPVVILGRL